MVDQYLENLKESAFWKNKNKQLDKKPNVKKDGSIGNIRYRGPDKNLEKEALRIIEKLPRMTPGKQRGRAVRVPFSIPITFKLQ